MRQFHSRCDRILNRKLASGILLVAFLGSPSFQAIATASPNEIVAWGGLNSEGELNVPPPNTAVVAVASGGAHSLGLKADGSVVA